VIHNTRGTYSRFASNKTEADIVQWDDGSWPDGLPNKDGANALSGAGSLDTATTRLSKTSRTKNLIIEFIVNFIDLIRNPPDVRGKTNAVIEACGGISGDCDAAVNALRQEKILVSGKQW
jgi:hypothetical protein